MVDGSRDGWRVPVYRGGEIYKDTMIESISKVSHIVRGGMESFVVNIVTGSPLGLSSMPLCIFSI